MALSNAKNAGDFSGLSRERERTYLLAVRSVTLGFG
jgi:hypothetical protein